MQDSTVCLFGSPQAVVSGERISLPAKPAGLIALVGRSPDRRARRGKLAAFLWPNEEPARARHNLRQALWYVRGLVGDAVLGADRSEVWLQTGGVTLDTESFLAAPESPTDESTAFAMAGALRLVTGDFLDGLDFSAGAEFEDWLLFEREGFRRIRRQRALSLAEWYLQHGRPNDAADVIDPVVRSDVLDEQSTRLLMEALAASGESARALGRYELLQRALLRDLGVDPAPETEALARQIASRRDRPPVEARHRRHDPSRGSARREGGHVAVTATILDRVPDAVTGGEYRYLADSLAGKNGAIFQSPFEHGHVAVFTETDAAVRFGLDLLQEWAGPADQQRGDPVRIAAACHFGPAGPFGETWIGRGISLAKAIAASAAPGQLMATEAVADALDTNRHALRDLGSHHFDGDHLPERRVYAVVPAQRRPATGLTANDWFLEGTSLIGGIAENTEKEADCYRRALEIDPGHAEAHNNLAVVLRRQGDLDMAVVHYRRALQERPHYAEAHYNYALLLQARGNLPGAEAHLRTAVRIRPDYVDAQLGLAVLLELRDKDEEARKRYEQVIRMRPGYAEAHSNYASLLARLGERDRAVAHYERALDLRPSYAEAHYNLALMRQAEGLIDEAIAGYRSALAANQGLVEAHNNLAVLLRERGALEEAERHLRRAIELRPTDSEAHHNLAALLEQQGRHGEAAEHRTAAAELAPP